MTAGIRSGTSNDGYIQVNGSDVITALSSGNVGIGNTSPSTKLHVTGDITATNFIGNISGTPEFSGDLSIADKIIHTGDTNTAIRFPAADTFSVETAGQQNVQVNGTRTLLKSPSGTNTTVRLQHQGNSGYGDIILDRTVNAFIIDNDPSNASNNQSYFSVKNKGTENLRILHDGRICMGSTNVGSGSADDLNIENTSDHGGITIRTPNNKWGSIHFADGGTGNELYRGQLSYDHSNDKMLIYVGSSQRLLINSGGSLGVSHDLSGTANYNRLMLHNPHDGSCWMQMTSTASGSSANSDGLSIGLNSSNMGHIWLRENAPLAFATNGTERFRVTQNSNSSHIGSFGTGSSHLNNCSTPDRASFKVGGRLHVEGVFGHNAMTGLYYNCYSGGNDLFYSGTYTPSGGDGRAAAITMRYGGVAVFVDNSSTGYSPTNQITTMQNALNIDRNGYVTKSKTPSFWVNATPTIGTQSGNTYVAYSFGNIKHNNGSHYNNSNGRFTAPIAGTYMFGGGLWCNSSDNNSGSHLLVFDKNGGEAGIGCNHRHSGNQLMATMVIELAANDYIQLGFASGSGGSVQGSTPRNYFWGYLVG